MVGKMGLIAQCWYWREIQAATEALLDGRLEVRSSQGQSTD